MANYERDADAERVVLVNSDGGFRTAGVKVDSAVGASGVAVTRTLAAVAGKRHRVAFVHVIGYNVAARTGNATPVSVTLTGLDASNISYPLPTAGAIGTIFELKMEGLGALEGLVNTAVVLTCPATTNVIWSATIGYTTAA